MAPGHFSYLFEAERFRQWMTPLISDLERGNYQRLRQLTSQYIQEQPKARILLRSFNLSYVYAYYEEPNEEYTEPEPGNCLVALLTPFLSPLPEGTEWGDNFWGGVDLMKDALKLVGWTQSDIDMFVFGKSLCELLSPQHASELYRGRFASGQTNDPWCAGEPGWLDLLSIERLEQKLSHSKPDILELAQRPELFVPRLVDQQFLERNLPQGYAHLEHVFTTAKIKGKELLVQIVS